jgi:hypothetical protein
MLWKNIVGNWRNMENLNDLLKRVEAEAPERNLGERPDAEEGYVEGSTRGVNSASGWVSDCFLYVLDGIPRLGINFRGTRCVYPESGEDDYYQLQRADSAGSWVHNYVYSSSYFTI